VQHKREPSENNWTPAITCPPWSGGPRSAALTLSDNAPSKLQKVPVTGVGVLPAVTFTPASLTFPTQLIFTTSKTKTLTLTNSGLGILNISTVAVTGPFAQTNNCGSTVNPAGSCTISVTFIPTTRGVFTASISITYNAPASPQSVSLTGTGTAVQLTPAGVSFGTQPTLSNKGHAAVSLASISITGADAGDFGQTKLRRSQSPTTVAAVRRKCAWGAPDPSSRQNRESVAFRAGHFVPRIHHQRGAGPVDA
jgi:hypothetical protein